MRIAGCVMLLVAVAGCSRPARPSPDPEAIFEPSAMRLHPVFTRVADWTADGRPDGIEALIELQDRFGDPTKASGRVIFELYAYRSDQPDPRGQRLVNPWIGDLTTLRDQEQRWNRTSRTYSFPLLWPAIDPAQTYVLTATFELGGGGRFFDRLVVTPAPAGLASGG